jgi:hypothetical protein
MDIGFKIRSLFPAGSFMDCRIENGTTEVMPFLKE